MARLRRSDPASPGIRRVRSGRGFRYVDAAGEPVHDPSTLDRIEQLVIPPAWTEVWITTFPNGHIQAVGTDAADRRQYLYHPGWRERMDRLKFDRALALAESLPAARRGVTIDLRRAEVPRERALAAAFRMLDTGSLRVGSERYALEHGSFGLSTLLCGHARVTGGDTVELRFPSKSGQEWDSDIRDPDLAAYVTTVKRRGARARLLAWRDDHGWHPLSAGEINDDVRVRTGGDFTAKDFRTLHGTIEAAISLARTGPRPTQSGRDRAIATAVRATSAALGNTPAVARASYIDPRLLDRYRAGRTIDPGRLASAESELRALLYD